MQSLPGNAFAIQPGNALAVEERGSLRSLAESTFRYRRLWAWVVLAILALTGLYILFAPRRYMSEMEILVQNKRGDQQITPNRESGVITINDVTEEQINSEIEMLRSRALADLVVDPYWEKRDKTKLSYSQLEAHDKAVQYFEKHLFTEMVRKSNVIHVTYTASDPKTATDTLNRLLSAFLMKQREIAQPPGTAQFFAAKAADFKKQLDQAQQDLATYQQQHQIVSLPDTEQNIDREINEAQTDLRSTDAQISEVTQRIANQTSQLKRIPTRQSTLERTIPNDYSVERLNTMLAELRNRRTDLMTKFTSQDPLVQDINKQISETETELAKAKQLNSHEQSTDVNPVWQTVSGMIIQDDTARKALQARHEALNKQITDLRSGLGDVETSTVAFNTLKQKVDDLQNDYQLYTQKHDEAMVADAMNESRLLNVAIEQNPTFSIIPARPKPVLDAVLGGFTAIFLASFMVFFAEMGRGTIATAGEIEKISRFPVLATVPFDRSLGSGRSGGHLGESAPVFVGLASTSAGDERRARTALMRLRKESEAL